MKTIAVVAFIACTLLADEHPVVTFPKHHQQIGLPNDPACPPGKQPCYRIEAEGRLPKGMIGIFAVEPAAESPRMFLQPRIHAADDDGSVSGTLYLGDQDNGAKQSFKIYLLACRDEHALEGKKSIFRVPAGCIASNAVKVERLR